MCCFSRPVISVSATNIFARAAEEGRQFLVYSMSIEAETDLAMILPLPVKTPAGEKDVRFIDLKDYPDFFGDLEKGFMRPPSESAQLLSRGSIAAPAAKLEVVPVGDFEASFVPTVKDFSRLDERFQLPADIWNKLPIYTDYGFAVFKLKPGALRIHPMAFNFPRRDQKTLFFPTVHIHDGKVHPKAHFDHALFCQPYGEHQLELGARWEESNSDARGFMNLNKAQGIVEADHHCYKRELKGNLANHDTVVELHT